MQIDSASSPDMPGMGELGISAHSVEEILQDLLTSQGLDIPWLDRLYQRVVDDLDAIIGALGLKAA
jgi:hypothetical protein